MQIFIAGDHAFYPLKEVLKPFLAELGHEVEDCGAHENDPADDYPDFVTVCAQKVAATPLSVGIIGGGTGNGEAMAANRVKGVRAAVFHGRTKAAGAVDVSGSSGNDDGFDIIRLTRVHNDANVLSLGARFLNEDEAKEAVRMFLATPFSGDDRHLRRIRKF